MTSLIVKYLIVNMKKSRNDGQKWLSTAENDVLKIRCRPLSERIVRLTDFLIIPDAALAEFLPLRDRERENF